MIIRASTETPIRYYLIDKLAAGFDKSDVCEQFQRDFGRFLAVEELDSMFSDEESQKAIKTRELEIFEEIKRRSLVNLSMDMIDLLKAKISELNKRKDSAAINSMLPSINVLKGYVELLMKKAQEQKKEEPKVLISHQENYLILENMAQTGALEIKDPKRIRQMLGMQEAEIIDVKPIDRG